jgi:transcriptional regulator with XRE-family HTH domain
MFAIPLDSVARKTSQSGAPKPPAWYAKLLVTEREALGLTRAEFAKRSGLDYNLIMRNEGGGGGDPSVKGSNRVRAALIKMGRTEIPPAPSTEDAPPPVHSSHAVRHVDPDADRLMKNLIRFREALGMDQFAAAFATKIPYEQYRAFETGDEIPSGTAVARLARGLGCRVGDLYELDGTLPDFDLDAQPSAWLGGAATAKMTAEERAIVEGVLSTVTERDRAEKRSMLEKLAAAKKRK